jgi:hypothetical protein
MPLAFRIISFNPEDHMEFSSIFLIACTVLYLYCTGGSWMLQIVSYPTYHHVGEREFVPFHVDSGKRLIPIFVIPAVLVCLATVALVFLRPSSTPLWASLVVALCSLVILVTTIVLEVPKHNALDKNGKNTALIDGLVRDNLPRAISWTLGSALLVFMTVQALTA